MAGVFNSQAQLFGLIDDSHPNLAIDRREPQCVVQQVRQCPAQHAAVTFDAGIAVATQFYLRVFRQRRKKLQQQIRFLSQFQRFALGD
ncbi:hypothetical protein D9M69_656380 [compost metagenome]